MASAAARIRHDAVLMIALPSKLLPFPFRDVMAAIEMPQAGFWRETWASIEISGHPEFANRGGIGGQAA
jgi:hypothetical protein